MNIFSNSFRRFRDDGIYIALLDIVTIALLLGLILVLRNYLGSLVLSIEGLENINEAIANEDLAAILASSGPVVFKYNLAFYFIFPAAFFLIAYCLQALSFGIAIERSKNVFDIKYIGKFMLFSLPAFLVFVYMANLLFNLLSLYLLPELSAGSYEDFLAMSKTLTFIAILMFIAGYFTLIAYGMLLRNDAKKTIKDAFKIGVKKSYIFLPFALMFVIVRIFIGNSVLGFLLSIYSQDIEYLHILIFLLLIGITAYMKILNVKLINKYQQES